MKFATIKGHMKFAILLSGYIFVTCLLLRSSKSALKRSYPVRSNMQKPPLYEARPESLPTKFNLYFADLKQVFLECTLAKNSQQLLQEKYGVYCPLKDPGACIERHLAFFNQQFYELYPNAVRLEYNLPSCNAIGLAYDTSNPGLFSGSQSEVFMTHVDYGNERLSFLSKVFKPVTPRQFQPRIGLARPILVSQEDQRNARRNDKGAYYRELEAYQSLRHSPYFLHPVCHWEEHLTIAYPYFDAGDMVPLVEDDNDILKRVNIDAVMRRVSRQLIEAVHQMHMAGIAHMDIKPENILIAGRSRDERLDFFLNPKSTVKIALIDLGLSVKKVDLQGIGCFRLGTKTTMSPEQLMCQTQSTGKHR